MLSKKEFCQCKAHQTKLQMYGTDYDGTGKRSKIRFQRVYASEVDEKVIDKGVVKLC